MNLPATGTDAKESESAVQTGAAGCAVWGVLNVTPDSFSDGGRYDAPDIAVAHAMAMLEDGADVIDVGGESTRPKGKVYGQGYSDVSADEEIRRTVPVIEALRAAQPDVVISIDTTKGAVARRAIEAGATFVNDVSGGSDLTLLKAVAEAGVDLVLMHNRARGEVDSENTAYQDVVEDVLHELHLSAGRAIEAGVARERVWFDPGIGFAKTARQSAALIAATPRFVATGHRVLVGPSRKSFIAELAPLRSGERPTPEERIHGTAAAVTAAVLGGAHAVRVHDVAEMYQATRLALALREERGR